MSILSGNNFPLTVVYLKKLFYKLLYSTDFKRFISRSAFIVICLRILYLIAFLDAFRCV